MRVVIAGAGVAGLEAVLALSELAGDRVDVDVVSPAETFVYRPMLVAEPFGSAEVLELPLSRVATDTGARHRRDTLIAVEPGARTVLLGSGGEIPYDALLVALGARPAPAVPGALTFGEAAERRQFAELLAAVGRQRMRRLIFVVPPTVTWSIAAYELALLTAAEHEARDAIDVEISVVTHESEPLALFGAAATATVRARLERAGITLRTGSRAERFEAGRLLLSGGGSLPADAVVALPALQVDRVPGLPQRPNGFVQTDVAMQVTGLERVWAAGDVTWFPIKQGGLAAQEADVAARAIAARAGADAPLEPFQPVLRGLLITGDAPEFMRSSRSGQGGDAASAGPLWAPASKLAGRYLGPYLARILGLPTPPKLADLEPEGEPEAAMEHQRAVVLILAAADADAAVGDFEGAIKWLSLVERLNLVIPPEYVARRHLWRRRLWPDEPPDAAAERIDPSFASADVALSDLMRRIGWLREIEHRNEDEMQTDLSRFDEDLHHLIVLARQTGVL